MIRTPDYEIAEKGDAAAKHELFHHDARFALVLGLRRFLQGLLFERGIFKAFGKIRVEDMSQFVQDSVGERKLETSMVLADKIVIFQT